MNISQGVVKRNKGEEEHSDNDDNEDDENKDDDGWSSEVIDRCNREL